MASLTIADIVASIADMVRYTFKITHHLHELRSDTAEERDADRQLMVQLSPLAAVLDAAKQMFGEGKSDQDLESYLLPTFVACGADIKHLYENLSKSLPDSDGSTAGHAAGNANNLGDSARVQEISRRLKSYTRMISFYYNIYSAGTLSSEKRNFKELQAWLSAYNPFAYLNQTLAKRQPGTGQWLLTDQRYTRWREEPGLVWLSGTSGSGKTVLSSIILDDIGKHTNHDPGRAAVYFFFDFRDARKQNAKLMVSSLIFQLLQRSGHCPTSLIELNETCTREGRPPSLDELLSVLRNMIEYFPEVFLVIDALDDCTNILELIKVVTKLASWSSLKLHTILTSRERSDIGRTVKGLVPESNHICLEHKNVNADIRRYIRQTLDDDAGYTGWNSSAEIRQAVVTSISNGAHGNFRWAFCQMSALGKCETQTEVMEMLDALPKSIEETYNRELCKISTEYAECTRRILMWLAFAETPLSLEEVAEVAAIDADRDTIYEAGEALEDSLEAPVICSTLVELRVELGYPGQKNRFVATLAHRSVKEFLLSYQISNGSSMHFGLNVQLCQTMIARACVGLLCQQRQLSEDGALSNAPSVVRYAKSHWLDHVRAITANPETANYLTFTMLERGDRSRKWQPPLNINAEPEEESYNMFLRDIAYPIQFAAYFGLNETVENLITQAGSKVYNSTMLRHSPLALAASQGQIDAMRTLIRYGAPVLEGNGHPIQEPLVAAIRSAQYEAVEFLINAGAPPNHKSLGDLPLREAIDTDSASLMSLLIEHSGVISPASLSSLLVRASTMGRKRIAQILLDNNADIHAEEEETWFNSIRCYGTPLCAAARNGHAEVVSMLLDRGADVNEEPMSPLIEAAVSGHIEVVEILLRRGAELDGRGRRPGSALSAALTAGHREIAWLLILHGADVTRRSLPFDILTHVLRRGYDDLAVAIIQRGYVVNPQGRWNVALPIACYHGCRETIKVLLQRYVIVNQSHRQYGTALQAAAKGGHADIVRLLLVNGADPNRGRKTLRSPLQRACANGDDKMAAVLLDYGADKQCAGFPGPTPLNIALLRGYVGIAKLISGDNTMPS